MPRPSKTLEEYKELGKQKNLELLQEGAPDLTTDSVRWKCLNCGRILTKAYNKLKFSPNPCRCQSSLALKPQDYEELADSLGIEWNPSRSEFFPKNNKEKVYWWSADRVLFAASYHELAYNNIPKRLQEIIDGQSTQQTIDQGKLGLTDIPVSRP